MCHSCGSGTSWEEGTAFSIHLNMICFICYTQEHDPALWNTGLHGMRVYKGIQDGNCTHTWVDSWRENLGFPRDVQLKFWMSAWAEVGMAQEWRLIFRNNNSQCIEGEGTEETVGLLWTVLIAGFWKMLRTPLLLTPFSDPQEFWKAAGVIRGAICVNRDCLFTPACKSSCTWRTWVWVLH